METTARDKANDADGQSEGNSNGQRERVISLHSPEIWQQVCEKYPYPKPCCRLKKIEIDEKRKLLYKRLTNDGISS